MKRFHSYIIAVGMFLSVVVVSCKEEKDETKKESGKMEMTTSKSGNVTIGLLGSGAATIDWGDGSVEETKTLFSFDYATEYVHDYSAPKTRTIRIFGNNITGLDCSSNQLISLDVSKNISLKYLSCDDNQLTNLDLSRNTALTILFCDNNQLSNLEVSKNIELIWLFCSGNQLTNLDVSKNAALTVLDCWNNQLMSLDVGSALIVLHCFDNQLTSLDVSKATTLHYLDCYANQLSDVALDVLFGTLPENSIFGIHNTIFIGGNPGTDNCNQSIAINKGWTVNIGESETKVINH